MREFMPDTPELIIANSSGVIRETRTIPTTPEAEEAPKSEFEKALAWYDFYKRKVDVGAIPRDQRAADPDLSALIRAKDNIEAFIKEADASGILEEVRQNLEDNYKELRGYSPAERLEYISTGRVLNPGQDWERSIWALPRFKDLEAKFRGLPNFLYLEVRESIMRYERKNSLLPERRKILEDSGDPRIFMDQEVYIGDTEFYRIRRQRTKESKFRPNRTFPERLEFHWAENVEELIPSVAEYLASVEKGVPDERVADVYQYLTREREEGLRMLETARLRLGVPDDNSIIRRLRAVIEARIDVFGGDRTVNRGGWGHFIDFWDHFANNFIAHHDAIYLEDQMVPMALHMLSRKDGIYWRGTEFEDDIQGMIERERPTDGMVERVQKEMAREIIEYLTTHELFLQARDFKNRFPGGVPTFHDPVEQKLLSHTGVFRNIKQDLDRKDGLLGLSDDQRKQRIRERILSRISEREPEFISQLPGEGDERDLALWKWVKGQNDINPIAWYPSGWDQVRLSIDRPELVLGRALTKQEFQQMYVPIRIEDYIAQNEDELNNPLYLTQEEYDNPKKREQWWERRKAEAEQKFQEARRWQIFTGAASRYGGVRLRFYGPDGKTVVRNKPFFAELRDRINNLPLGTFPIRDKLRDEFGVANIFPSLSSYLVNDDATMAWFAPLFGKTPDDKVALIQMLEKERRTYRKVIDGIVADFMKSKDGNGYRKRVNHKGGNIDIRKVLDSRFIISTSGGVGATDLVPEMDLGVHDLFLEFGQEDAREFMGWVKRRNEVEFQYQSIWNILDAIDYWKRLNGAETLRKIIGGGDLGEGKKVPGFLNGPLNGAYQMRDFLDEGPNFWDGKKHPNGTFDDFFRQLSKVGHDKAIKVASGILEPLIQVMEGRKYVENRMSQFSSNGNWKYDNTLLWYAFRDWVRNSAEFKKDFDYADEARSDFAILIYENVLDANYLILSSEERKKLFPEKERETDPQRKIS